MEPEKKKRKPGRPSKGDEAQVHPVSVKLTRPMEEAARATAAARGESIYEWLRRVIAEAVQA